MREPRCDMSDARIEISKCS